MKNKFCPNINHPEAKALINQLGLLGFYKAYIKNGYQVPGDTAYDLSETRSIEDLLFVNKDLFNANQQNEIVHSMVYLIQEIRKEGQNSAKFTKIEVFKDFKQTYEDLLGSQDQAEIELAANYKKVLDNFEALYEIALNKIREMGVSVKRSAVQDQDGVEIEEDVYNDSEALLQKLNYADESSFMQSTKDTASSAMKTVLSLIPKYEYRNGKLVTEEGEDGETIPSHELNYLGLARYEDMDVIWNDLLYTLHQVPVGKKLEYLTSSANPKHQIIAELIKSDPRKELINQFESTFSVQQARFVTGLISRRDPNGVKSITILDTNRNNPRAMIIDSWYNNFIASDLVVSDAEGNRFVDRELGAELNRLYKEAVDLLHKDKNAGLETIYSLFNKIGIPLSKEILGNKDIRGLVANKFKYIFETLGGAQAIGDIENTLDANNPFIHDMTQLEELARLENEINPGLFESSFVSGDNKSKYSFVNNTYLSHHMRKLTTDLAYLRNLQKTGYASGSYLLENMLDPVNGATYRNNFQLHYVDTLGNQSTNQPNKSFGQMTTKEKEFSRVAYFQNSGIGTSKGKSDIGYFIGLIPSDKTTIPIFKSVKMDVKVDSELNFNRDTLDVMYGQFISEYNRVRNTMRENKEGTVIKLKGYHGENGLGSTFVVFDFMNDLLIQNGTLLELDDDRINTLVKPALEAFLKQLTQDTIAYWTELGIYNKDLLDKSYATKKGYRIPSLGAEDYANLSAEKRAEHDKKTMEAVNRDLPQLAADYAVNYFVFYMNQTQLISGDPALHGKGGIETTMVNFYKRMAKDIAPGLDGQFEDTHFNTIFLKDLDYTSDHLMEYMEKVDASISEPYGKINPADAQEYTTLDEHLRVMRAYGRLTSEQEGAAQRLLEGGENAEDIQLILQPMKPVYVDSVIDGNINKLYYIKTSSFPLIPALTKGLEIDKLRVAMENHTDDAGRPNPIGRAVYESGVKLGLRTQSLTASADGTVFNELDIKPDQVTILPRSGFRIQQEIPFHEAGTINEGSQARKLILNNLLNGDVVNFNGKQYSGRELKEIYEKLHIEKIDRAFDRFMKEFGVDPETGKLENIEAIAEILKEEAVTRGYPVNDVYSIQVVEENGRKRFKVPLGFINNSSRFESLLTSIITNRVIKSELPGFAAVQGASSGFAKIAGDENLPIFKNSITWVDPNDTKLNYVTEKDGKLIAADILVPNYIKGINLRDYVKEDGSLDTGRIPKEILTVIGLRIPTQGYNSIMKFNVKGFLPSVMGNLVIVPAEITVQMGSDFDVDKLYVYNYHHNVDRDGKVVKITTELPDKPEDIDYGTLSDKEIDNLIIQVFEDRMSDGNIFDQVLEPNGFGKLKEVSARVGKLSGGNKAIHTFSTRQQNSISDINNSGKMGVAKFSLASTFFRAAQDANLIMTVPYVVKNSKGNVVDVDSLSNVKNIDGNNISNVIMYLQSAAVDNANEQILGNLNINSHTMDVASTMAMMGFSEEHIGYFMSQPIIREYVALMNNGSDLVNTETGFDPKLHERSISNLVHMLVRGASAEMPREQLISMVNRIPYGAKELEAYLEKTMYVASLIPVTATVEELEMLQKISNVFQLRVLIDFDNFRDISSTIRLFQSGLNVDTKGLGSNLVSVEAKYQQIGSMNKAIFFQSSGIINLEGLLSDNTSAKALDVLVKARSIFASISPYATNNYSTIVETLATGVDLNLSETNLRDIYANIKSYIMSNRDFIGRDVEETRNGLLYGKANIARRWLNYSKTDMGKRNPLTKRITPVFAKKKKDANGLKANNAPGSNNAVDLNQSLMYFYEMINSSDAREKQLAEDIVAYYVLTGAQFGATSIGKYITYDVLERYDFSKKLRDIEDRLYQDDFLEGFVDQYFQNNPFKAKSFNLDKHPKTILVDKRNVMTTGGSLPATHIVSYNAKAKEPVLYKRIKVDQDTGDFIYEQLEILGTKTLKKYNFHKKQETVSDRVKEDRSIEASVREPEAYSKTDVLKDNYNYKEGTQAVLRALVERSANETNRKLALDLLKSPEALNAISLGESDRQGINGSYSNNTISLNFDQIAKSSDHNAKFEEVFLHELIHGLTVEALFSDKLNHKQQVAKNKLTRLFDEYVKSVSDKEGLAEYTRLIHKFANKEALGEAEMDFLRNNKSKFYYLTNLKEFLAVGLTNDAVRAELGSKNLWAKILEYLGSLLGVSSNDLHFLYTNTLDLISNTNDKNNNGNIIDFKASTVSGYVDRTVKNASADATIAIATNFNTAGEKLTKNSVLKQGKKYISIDANNLNISEDRINSIVNALNSVNAKTLNIAGNGIYTMKNKYTQETVDDFTYGLLKAVMNHPNLKNKISLVRSGGQTGFDEAGAKAGQKLGIKTLILAPKGWTFRNEHGVDIFDEVKFKARFNNVLSQGSLFDISEFNNEEFDRQVFIEQRNEFFKNYRINDYFNNPHKKYTPEAQQRFLAANGKPKYNRLMVSFFENELRVNRNYNVNYSQDIDYDIAEKAPLTKEEKFIDRIINKFEKTLKDRLARQKALGDKSNPTLDASIIKLQKRVENLKNERSVVYVVDNIKSRLTEIEKGLNNNPSKADIAEYIDHLTEFQVINEQVDFNVESELGAKYAVIVDTLAGMASKLKKKTLEKGTELLDNESKQRLDLPYDIATELNKGIKDVGFGEATFLDGSNSSSVHIQTIELLIEDSQDIATDELNKFNDDLGPIVKDFLKKYKNYNTLLQEDSKGKLTGALINKYQDEFYKKSKGDYAFWKANTVITLSDINSKNYEDDRKIAASTLSAEDYSIWVVMNDPALRMKELKRSKKKPPYKPASKYLTIKPIDKWLDPKYAKLKALGEEDPAVKLFDLIEPIIRRNNKLHNQQINYIPEIAKGPMDYLLRGDFKGGLQNAKSTIIDNLDLEESYRPVEISPITGEELLSIPVTMFGNKLSADEKSYDLARIVERTYHQEKLLDLKHDVEPLLNIYYALLKASKQNIGLDAEGNAMLVEKEPARLLEQAKYLINNFLYSQNRHTGKQEKSLGRRTDQAVSYFRVLGMGWNPFSAIGNATQGIMSNLIFSVGSHYFSQNDYLKASSIMLHSIAGNTGIAKKISKAFIYTDAFVKSNDLNFGKSKQLRTSTSLRTDVLKPFDWQEKGEYFVQGQTFVSVMLAEKVTRLDGTEGNLWDAFDNDMNWRSDVYGENPYDDRKSRFKLKYKIRNAIIDVHGNYSRPMQGKKHYYVRALMVFRTWLPQAINNRWGDYTENKFLGTQTKGRWRSYPSFIKNEEGKIDFGAARQNILWLLKLSGNTTMSDLDKRNIRKNMGELMLLAVITTAILVLKSMIEDDDDDVINFQKYLINAMMRSQNELMFFMLPSSFDQIIKDPLPLMSIIRNMTDITEASVNAIQGDDEYQRGFRKGKSKLLKETGDMIPGWTQLDKNLGYLNNVFGNYNR